MYVLDNWKQIIEILTHKYRKIYFWIKLTRLIVWDQSVNNRSCWSEGCCWLSRALKNNGCPIIIAITLRLCRYFLFKFLDWSQMHSINLPRDIEHQRRIYRCMVKALVHIWVYSVDRIEKTSQSIGPLDTENFDHLKVYHFYMKNEVDLLS